MNKFGLAIALTLSLYARVAGAQTCSVFPNTLTNGATADASQVMANFNYAAGCINGLRGYLGGLTISNDGSNPNTVIDTAAGVTDSDDVTTMMTLSALTKNANASWAVGSGNGCLDTGSGLAASTWYHLFVIARTDTGVVDELCSTSATAPTLPTSYTKKRRIGSIKTDASSHILAFVQNGDEFWWRTASLDLNNYTLAAGNRMAFSLTVPSSVQTEAVFNVQTIATTSTPGVVVLSSSDQNDIANSGQSDLISTTPSIYAAGRFTVRTNTSSQVFARAPNGPGLLWMNTLGWIDTRGRFN